MKKRLFIALNFNNQTKLELVQILNRLPSSQSIKKTKVDNLHLTLQFLGNIDEKLIPKIQKAINNISNNYPPLKLIFTHLGAFPNLRAPRTLWIGIKGTKLKDMQQGIRQNLEKIKIKIDDKPYISHLTLARIKNHLFPKTIREIIHLNTQILPPHPTIITSIDLMASQLTPDGPIYTQISVHNLEVR